MKKTQISDFKVISYGKKGGPIVVKVNGEIRHYPKAAFWQFVRKVVIARDGGKCTNCTVDVAKVLCVHHLDGDRKNNKLSNLATLCFNCHMLTHHHAVDELDLLRERFGRLRSKLESEWGDGLREAIKNLKRRRSPISLENCFFHPDRAAKMTIAFDPATGKSVSQNKWFGVCKECAEVILESAP